MDAKNEFAHEEMENFRSQIVKNGTLKSDFVADIKLRMDQDGLLYANVFKNGFQELGNAEIMGKSGKFHHDEELKGK
jgi:hypothetical protein